MLTRMLLEIVGQLGSDVQAKALQNRGIVLSEDMLRQRVTDAYNEAFKASPILADQSADKQAAITDLIYNLGLDGYVPGHSLKPLIEHREMASSCPGN